ncbi:MAG: hypothetical protein ACTHM6_09605 [Tepidisphaeraceae bacterium]
MSQSQTVPPQGVPQPVIDYKPASPAPRRSWFNVRILIFALVIGAIIGTPVYMYVDQVVHQGINVRSDGYTEVNLKAISLFPFDQQMGQTSDIPERFRALDGKKVIMVGEIWAHDAAGDALDDFDLCYSIAKCCFSGPPQVQHFVKSKTEAGPMPYYNGLVRVKGTFKVGVTRDKDQKITAVYHLLVDSVEPV